MAGRLDGKVAVVTGAASGFGAGIARRFALEGARLVVADIDGEGAERVADQVGRTGPAVSVAVDVSVPAQVNGMIAAAVDGFGRLDVLVNNAGYTHPNQPMLEVGEEDFDRMIAVNCKALYLAARAAVPHLAKCKGSIITTASTAGLRPRPGLTWYNASKGFAITATKSMAVELAPQGIRVNCLCPVAGETQMLERFMGADTPENRERFISTIPLGRLSKPEDIASAALWLASDEAEFVTGVALEVDGGRCV